ncbi:hypothetical protein J1614_009707 [Plenodomus biglobosus]|nr:hypothetical protein J1614_009707 [Plenodomus biglobosus]
MASTFKLVEAAYKHEPKSKSKLLSCQQNAKPYNESNNDDPGISHNEIRKVAASKHLGNAHEIVVPSAKLLIKDMYLGRERYTIAKHWIVCWRYPTAGLANGRVSKSE